MYSIVSNANSISVSIVSGVSNKYCKKLKINTKKIKKKKNRIKTLE